MDTRETSPEGNSASKESDNLLIEMDNGVCVLTFNRTKNLNIFSEELLTEFSTALDKVSADPSVKVIVLLSACEKAFTAGADIKKMNSMDEDEGRRWSELGHAIARKLEAIPQPVIMGINGIILGGGVEFACACDIRIAAEGSLFSQPEIDIGVIPGWGGTQRLARIVGIARAKELIYTGKRVDAHQAMEMGLVNHVVPKENLKEAAVVMAQCIALKGKVALFNAKKAINKLYDSFLDEGLEFEVDRWSELFSTYDQKEGMRAFIEGRHPVFKDM